MLFSLPLLLNHVIPSYPILFEYMLTLGSLEAKIKLEFQITNQT